MNYVIEWGENHWDMLAHYAQLCLYSECSEWCVQNPPSFLLSIIILLLSVRPAASLWPNKYDVLPHSVACGRRRRSVAAETLCLHKVKVIRVPMILQKSIVLLFQLSFKMYRNCCLVVTILESLSNLLISFFRYLSNVRRSVENNWTLSSARHRL